MGKRLLIAPFALALAAGPALADSPAETAASVAQGASYPKGQYAELEALPDWGGIWFVERRPSTEPLPQPVLKGTYREQNEAWKAEVRANDGVERRTRSNCSPPGMPRIMQIAQYPFEFLFTPGRVTINQEAWMQTRTIWTDGRSHPEDPDPSYMGYSIGHWDGDTLVAETMGVLNELPFSTGALHSDQFRIVERIYLDPADPDRLINEMVMEDPEALAETFTVKVTYRRDRESTLFEFQCSENNRNPVNENGETEYE